MINNAEIIQELFTTKPNIKHPEASSIILMINSGG